MIDSFSENKDDKIPAKEILKGRAMSQETVFKLVEEQTTDFKAHLGILNIPPKPEEKKDESETQQEDDFKLDYSDIPARIIAEDFIDYPSDETIQEWEDYYNKRKEEGDLDYYDFDNAREGREVQKDVLDTIEKLSPEMSLKLRYLIPKMAKGGIRLSEWIDGYYGMNEKDFSQIVKTLENVTNLGLYVMGRFFENGISILSIDHEVKNFELFEQAFKLIPTLKKEKKRELYSNEIFEVYEFLERNGPESEKTIKQIHKKMKKVLKKDSNIRHHVSSMDFLTEKNQHLLEPFLSFELEELDIIEEISKKINGYHDLSLFEILNFLPYFRKNFGDYSRMDFNKENTYPLNAHSHYKNVSQTLFFAFHQDIPSDTNTDFREDHHYETRPNLHHEKHAKVFQRYVEEHYPQISNLCETLEIEKIDFGLYSKNLNQHHITSSFTFANKTLEDIKRIGDSPELIQFLSDNFLIKNISTLLLISGLIKRTGVKDFTRRAEYIRKITDGHKIDLSNNIAFYFLALEAKYGGWQHNQVSTPKIEALAKIHKELYLPKFQGESGYKIEEDYIVRKYLKSEERKDNNDRSYERNQNFGNIKETEEKIGIWSYNQETYKKAKKAGFLTPEKESNIYQARKILQLFKLNNHEEFLNTIDPEGKHVFEDYKNWEEFVCAYEGEAEGLLRNLQYGRHYLSEEDWSIMQELYPKNWATYCELEIEKFFTTKDHNGSTPDITEEHFNFLKSIFPDDSQFYRNFVREELRASIKERYFRTYNIIRFLVENDPEWVSFDLVKQAIFKDMFAGYKDEMFKFLIDKCQMELEINDSNWSELTILLFKKDVHVKEENKKKLSAIINNPNSKEFVTKRIKDLIQKILHTGTNELTKDEEFLMQQFEKHHIDFKSPLNLLTEGDHFIKYLFDDINKYKRRLDVVEEGFYGKLSMPIDTENNQDIINPITGKDNQKLVQKIFEIANRYFEIKNFSYETPHPNPKHTWNGTPYSEKRKSSTRRDFIKELESICQLLTNLEKNEEYSNIYNFAYLKDKIEKQKHLFFLKEYVNFGCLPHKSNDIATSPFFKGTNKHTQSAIAGMSLLIASGSLQHPKIQIPLKKIPNLITYEKQDITSELIDQYHLTLKENVQRIVPAIEGLTLNERQTIPGLMPIGGKIHVEKSIDSKLLDFVSDIFGFDSSPFRLIHAGESLLLPALPTDFEVSIFIKILELFGAISPNHFDLQTCVGGRLNPENAAIVGASMLLATEKGVHYQTPDFKTTHDDYTGARIMAYDAGVKNSGLPFDIEEAKGRTDVLGRHSLNDLGLHRTIGTLMAHKQFNGMFAETAKNYETGFMQLLEKNGLQNALSQSAWVYNHAQGDDSLENHHSMLSQFTNTWYENKQKSDYGMILDVYKLIQKARNEMNVISQQNISENHPEHQKLMTF